MKTSLNISDKLFREAKEESLKTGKPVSEVISLWAQIGREQLRKTAKEKKNSKFKPLNLGGPALIDISSRKNWMDALDDDCA